MADFSDVATAFRHAAQFGRATDQPALAAYRYLLGWFDLVDDPEFNALLPETTDYSNWSA